MFQPIRAEPRPPSRQPSKTRLKLRTTDGDGWDLTVSAGMERFIGSYSQVPGLSSGSRRLDYQPVG